MNLWDCIAGGAIALVIGSGVATASVIDFDTASNWTGSGSLTSYNSGHVYEEQDWTFTGGPALRQGTTAQDGFAGALGTYSWRLQNVAVTWTATYDLAGSLSQFGFDVRRWDGSPSPSVAVAYSTDGGSTYSSSVVTINNTYLGDSSDWTTFSYDLPTPATFSAGDFIVQLSSTGGERIMLDNFSFTVPEPASLMLVSCGLVAMLGRRNDGRKTY